MLVCMDFTGQKVNLACVKNGKEKSESSSAAESPELEVMESLEVNVSDLEEYLQGKSGEIKEIRVSGMLEHTFHKIFVLPDLKKKTLRASLENEVVKEFGAGCQFREQDLGEVPGPADKINRKIMVAGINRDALEDLSRVFGRCRIKPSIYTTYPLALQALLEKTGVLSEESLAFVVLDSPTTRIIIFKGKEIRLTREVNAVEADLDRESPALVKDIYRTLLFYNNTYPEEKVTRLALAGSLSNSQIAKNVSEKTGAEIAPLDLGAVCRGIEETPGIHHGCLGLALLNPNEAGLGFVPFSVQEKKAVKKMLTLSSSAFLGVLLVFALIISRFSLDLRNLNAFHGGVKGEITMKEDRLKEMPLEFVSQSIETTQPPWSDILLELAAVVPPGVALKTLTLKNVKKMWRGEVTGIADGSDEINSLLQVEELQNSFAKSPLFTGVKLIERKLQGNQVVFKIIYQLDV
ncbi:MAG: PilN domain-containing protein [Candidatus Zixiibacteriota bacterium]